MLLVGGGGGGVWGSYSAPQGHTPPGAGRHEGTRAGDGGPCRRREGTHHRGGAPQGHADRVLGEGGGGRGDLTDQAPQGHTPPGAGRREGTQVGGKAGLGRRLKGTHRRGGAPRGHTGREGGSSRLRKGTHRWAGHREGTQAGGVLRRFHRGLARRAEGYADGEWWRWLKAGRLARCRRGGPGS